MTELRGNGLAGPAPADLRLVLLGSIGCGKTSSADTILGERTLQSSASPRSSSLRRGSCQGRSVTLVEGPRWCWVGSSMDQSARRETERAVSLAAPGPHAVLLLVPVNQFTEMEGFALAELEQLFGPEVLEHTVVLLTCGDYLIGRTVQEYLQREDPGLQRLIARVGGRFHVFNNRQQEREQVQALLQQIDSLVQQRGPFLWRTAQERELERRVLERKKELMDGFRTQKDQRRKSVLNAEGSAGPAGDVTEERAPERAGGHARLHSAPPESDGQAGWRPSFTHSTVHSSPEKASPGTSPTSPPRSPAFTPPSSAASGSPRPGPELRLVLLGRSGSGKSTAGNLILGQEVFESRPESFTAITQKCEKKKAELGGRKVAVVDTPDWFNSERAPDEVRAQVSSCVALSSPGPHAFLLCVPIDQPAKSELQALTALAGVFGPEAVRGHTLVLFTHVDRLRASGTLGGLGVEEYVSSQRQDLLELVERCGDRFHLMEGGAGRRQSVAQLLEKVEQAVLEAGGRCYSSPAFQEAEELLRRRQRSMAEARRQSNSLSTVQEDEMEDIRGEAELSAVDLRSLPPISSSTPSPSVLRSVMKKLHSASKRLFGLLTSGRDAISGGAAAVGRSPVWGRVGRGAQSAGSSVCQMMGGAVPQAVLDSSSWVRSRAKVMAAKPIWKKLGLGTKMVAGGSVTVGTTISTKAKEITMSPVWWKVYSGAKVGAKLMAKGSVKLGAKAKNVAQSPVWPKVGYGAKEGARRMAQSPLWGKMATTIKNMPKVTAAGAVAGLVLGVLLGGLLGGAVGALAGTGATEVARLRMAQKRRQSRVVGFEPMQDNGLDAATKKGRAKKKL